MNRSPPSVPITTIRRSPRAELVLAERRRRDAAGQGERGRAPSHEHEKSEELEEGERREGDRHRRASRRDTAVSKRATDEPWCGGRDVSLRENRLGDASAQN